jgi:hypothetical protein
MTEQYAVLNLREESLVIGVRAPSFLTRLHVNGLFYLEVIKELKALGHRAEGAHLYFAPSIVLALFNDEQWLNRVVKWVRDHNRSQLRPKGIVETEKRSRQTNEHDFVSEFRRTNR